MAEAALSGTTQTALTRDCRRGRQAAQHLWHARGTRDVVVRHPAPLFVPSMHSKTGQQAMPLTGTKICLSTTTLAGWTTNAWATAGPGVGGGQWQGCLFDQSLPPCGTPCRPASFGRGISGASTILKQTHLRPRRPCSGQRWQQRRWQPPQRQPGWRRHLKDIEGWKDAGEAAASKSDRRQEVRPSQGRQVGMLPRALSCGRRKGRGRGQGAGAKSLGRGGAGSSSRGSASGSCL